MVPSAFGPSAFGMMDAQAVAADAAHKAVAQNPTNPYSKYIFTRKQGDIPQVVQPNLHVSYSPRLETRILKDIDYIDSEISSHEKEICKLLNL